MKKLLKAVSKINRKSLRHAKRDQILLDQFEGLEGPIDTKHMLISLMLPPAIKMFTQEMEREVESLCGTRYEHGKTLHRWGKQNGSIVLGNQHVAIEKSRVRNPKTGQEVDLESYKNFQDPKLFEQTVFTEGLKRVSQRDGKKD